MSIMKLKNIVFPLLLPALLLLLVYCCVRPMACCYRTFTLLGGSMNPAIKTGSLIVVQAVAPEELVPGDIITFRNTSKTKVITHRVVAVERTGSLCFITRGDANTVNDYAPVPASDIIGKVQIVIPHIGGVIHNTKNNVHLLLILLIPAVLVVIPWQTRSSRKFREE